MQPIDRQKIGERYRWPEWNEVEARLERLARFHGEEGYGEIKFEVVSRIPENASDAYFEQIVEDLKWLIGNIPSVESVEER